MIRILLVTFALMITSQSLRGQSIDDPNVMRIIEASTTSTKSPFHVQFIEWIGSHIQQEWANGYAAEVVLTLPDGRSMHFTGSSLPNSVKRADASYQFSVLMATCQFGRFYKWKRDVRSGTGQPCLRLVKRTPTVQVNSERAEIPATLIREGTISFAEDILVHKGDGPSNRGSAGCLTIDPASADQFFKLIPPDARGTLEVVRRVGAAPMGDCW